MKTWKHKHDGILKAWKHSQAAIETYRNLLGYALTGQARLIGCVRGEYSGTLGSAYSVPDGRVIIVWDHSDTSGRFVDCSHFNSPADMVAFYDTLVSPWNRQMADKVRKWMETQEQGKERTERTA